MRLIVHIEKKTISKSNNIDILNCIGGCDGKLIFVLKMAKTEIVKGTKLERVNLVLMNMASSNVGVEECQNFSVQSEYNTWWLGAFKVDKESHEVLKWVFNQTDIPNIIECQSKGQILYVVGVGDFVVEWHIAADLKTPKCLFGCE